LTEAEVRSITVPTEILVGNRDPVRNLYVSPLKRVRTDWPVIEITGAGHMNCVARRQFTEELRKMARQTHHAR
jgi:pimeloyl-ACP methyl ester carboxylesterase